MCEGSTGRGSGPMTAPAARPDAAALLAALTARAHKVAALAFVPAEVRALLVELVAVLSVLVNERGNDGKG